MTVHRHCLAELRSTCRSLRATFCTLFVAAAVAGALLLVAPLNNEAAAQAGSSSRASRLTLRDACGWQGAGRNVWLQNTRRNRGVLSTVRETCNCGRDRWSRTQSYELAPGAEMRIGCTRGDTSVEYFSHIITGEKQR